MTLKNTLTAAAVSVASVVSPAAKAQELSPNMATFCAAAEQHGARSWQAFAAFDTAVNHAGVDFYGMSPEARAAAIDRELALTNYPELFRQGVKESMMEKYAEFNRAAEPQKLIKMLQELDGHGQGVSDVDTAYQRNCG